MVGSVLAPDASLAARYQATADSVVNAVIDFAVRGLPVTRESGHYLLVLGLLCWANGQFAASAVFRHGRPIGPIIVLGSVLVANMSATSHDQIWFLVLFSWPRLFLLTRLHALEERATWIRRRIGDPTVVGLALSPGRHGLHPHRRLPRADPDGDRPLGAVGRVLGRREAGAVEISQWLQRIIPAAPDSGPSGCPRSGRRSRSAGSGRRPTRPP